MTEYVTLIGTEEVRAAGNRMGSAAEQMSRSANQIDDALRRHQQFLEDWLYRFEAAIKKIGDTP
jgi:hypothetical protein